MDFRPYNRRALDLSELVVDQACAAPERLELPTPCAPWTVRELLSHMVGQHLRFGAVARGDRPKGSAAKDEEMIHEGLTYDLELQSEDGLDTNADRVLAAWHAPRNRSSFLASGV